MVSRTAALPTTTVGQSSGSQTNTSLSNTTGQSSTNGSTSASQSTSQTNMTQAGLDALDSLIASLGGGSGNPFAVRGGGKGNTANGQKLTDQWEAQIGKLNQLASDYSKSNAFKDSDVAVQGALAQALQKSMPTITAGIQAAGTSGSAMSALLTQQAAEEASYNAAQLGVSAAISYGQIQANALSSAGGLITSGDPAMNALLAALGINKGSVTNTNSNSNSSSSSNTSSSQQTATTQNQTSNQNSSQTNGLAGGTTTTDSGTKTTAGLSSSGQNWYTPSSYQSSGYQAGQSSYSQFN